jgi:hypothetical protein
MSTDQENDTEPPVSPLLTQAIETFYRELPVLLKTHNWQWVAYHGDKCMGFARTETELYQKCLRQGIKEGEFFVFLVHTQALYDHEEIDVPPYV